MAAFNSLRAALVLAMLTALAVAQPPPPPAPVLLGGAGDFVVLAKAGIPTVPASVDTGDIGVSPLSSAYCMADRMTCFDGSLEVDSANTISTTPVNTDQWGYIYASDTSPTPSVMTSAITDVEKAYNDAAARPLSDGANIDIKAGLISGETFTEGVYNWGSDINFASDIYLKGSSSSFFIFQTTGNVVVGSNTKVILQDEGTGNGKPKASNIVWQVAGSVDAGTSSHLEGVWLVKTHATLQTLSSLIGRILAQGIYSLDKVTITATITA